jgi:hypothetical protein
MSALPPKAATEVGGRRCSYAPTTASRDAQSRAIDIDPSWTDHIAVGAEAETFEKAERVSTFIQPADITGPRHR